MRTEPFTVGIIQDAASDDRQATIDATIPRIREAAERGAQVVCLKELFNAPYFCKSQQCERVDIAEPIPGPTTEVMQRIARELAIVLVVPLFERQARERQKGALDLERVLRGERVDEDGGAAE